MFWKRLLARQPKMYASLCRRTHELWLERVLTGRHPEPPRIPVRKVSEGGFSRMLERPGGRERADRWWASALDRVELKDQEMAP